MHAWLIQCIIHVSSSVGRLTVVELINASNPANLVELLLNLKRNNTQRKYGNVLLFNTKTFHGTHKNLSKKNRLSFDFRILLLNQSAGTKPLDEFYDSSTGVQESTDKISLKQLEEINSNKFKVGFNFIKNFDNIVC